ncbi:hypothetical protein V6N13_027715 [Hibiscus sabdariffa]|uniref:Uncharacterized protein n=1 Tax=Hibiscus sabdariffa TaxID=183260 RepID=A0ABR2CFD0_9ROSI
MDNREFKGKEEMGSVAVHSQVRKIKQESHRDQIVDWPHRQAEVRGGRHQHQHQLSPSPLGLRGAPISVGP